MEEIKITEEQRERIRKIQLEMLREVHRICEETISNMCWDMEPCLVQ